MKEKKLYFFNISTCSLLDTSVASLLYFAQACAALLRSAMRSGTKAVYNSPPSILARFSARLIPFHSVGCEVEDAIADARTLEQVGTNVKSVFERHVDTVGVQV